jgi:iron donor protein CyaY
MKETEYHQKSEDILNRLQIVLEPFDQNGDIEIEYQGGILTIALQSGKQLLVSKHTTSRQIWLSSPVSGGLHFSYKNAQWVLPDGRRLEAVLRAELEQLAGLSVDFVAL